MNRLTPRMVVKLPKLLGKINEIGNGKFDSL